MKNNDIQDYDFRYLLHKYRDVNSYLSQFNADVRLRGKDDSDIASLFAMENAHSLERFFEEVEKYLALDPFPLGNLID